jgi:hypothetical protein
MEGKRCVPSPWIEVEEVVGPTLRGGNIVILIRGSYMVEL